MKVIYFLLLTFSFSAFSQSHFSEKRTYTNFLFDTQEECDVARERGINCSQFIQLFPDGAARLLLTDIMHRGSYQINNQWTSLSSYFPQFDFHLDFHLSQDLRVLYYNGDAWYLKE